MYRFLFLLPLFLFPGLAATQSMPDWMAGHWEGIGYQTDVVSEWLSLLDWYPGQEHPLIEYPELECKGHWVLRRREADQLVFQEIITRNSGRCANLDWIYVKRAGPDELWVEFAHVRAPESIIATARLRRRSLP